MPSRPMTFISLFFCLSLFLTACDAPLLNTPPPSPNVPEQTPTLPLTPTSETSLSATATPTVTDAPALVVLVAPPATDPALESLLDELAAAAGLRFEVRSTLTAAQLTADLNIVVALPPDPGLAELAAAAPQTTFLGVGIPDLRPAANLSVIGAPGADERGFLAGYIAAAVTSEWRVGVIGVSDTTEGIAARQGYLNGAIFFCGLCKQLYPPFFSYPLYVEMPAASSAAEWQAAADVLIGKAVKTVYVVPGAGNDDLLIYLGEAGINLIGEGTPPNAVEEHWIASIQADFLQGLRQIWPLLLEGKGGETLPLPLALSNINATLFSPGRQRLTAEMMQDLSSGMIDTGVK